MMNLFKADIKANLEDMHIHGINLVFYALFNFGLWALAVFRFGKWVKGIRFAPLRMVLTVVYFLAYKMTEAITGIRIAIESEIGPGLVIHNHNGILIHGVLGKHCQIVQGAQLISRSNFKLSGFPTLGDNVFVGSGAKILGAVTIGSGSRIGANVVVRRDIPEDSLVLPPDPVVIEGYYRKKREQQAQANQPDPS